MPRHCPGNPYDGHTLETVLPDVKAITGVVLKRAITDAGYKGHNAPLKYRFKIFIQGQKRGMTVQIKRLLRRRAAIEPVIGCGKGEHRMGRNYLVHAEGDAINVVLAASGYNFRRLRCWAGSPLEHNHGLALPLGVASISMKMETSRWTTWWTCHGPSRFCVQSHNVTLHPTLFLGSDRAPAVTVELVCTNAVL